MSIQYKHVDLENRPWIYDDKSLAMDSCRRYGGSVTVVDRPDEAVVYDAAFRYAQKCAVIWEKQRALAMDAAENIVDKPKGPGRAGLPDKHNPNGGYYDKDNPKVSNTRGVFSGREQAKSSGRITPYTSATIGTRAGKRDEFDYGGGAAEDEEVGGGLADNYVSGRSQKTSAPDNPPKPGKNYPMQGGLDEEDFDNPKFNKPPAAAPKPAAAPMRQPPMPAYKNNAESVNNELDQHESDHEANREQLRQYLEAECQLDDDAIEQALQLAFADQMAMGGLPEPRQAAARLQEGPQPMQERSQKPHPAAISTPSQPAQSDTANPVRRMAGDMGVEFHRNWRKHLATPMGIYRARMRAEQRGSPFYKMAMDQYSGVCRRMETTRHPDRVKQAPVYVNGERIG
jgi:hypothetical protein